MGLNSPSDQPDAIELEISQETKTELETELENQLPWMFHLVPHQLEPLVRRLYYYWNAADMMPVKEREGTDGEAYTFTLRDFYEKGCIFIAMPRAASSGIRQCAFGHLAGGRKTAEEYRRLFGDLFRWYFVFTFVRNPYTRLASAYDHLRKGGHPAWPGDKRFGEEVISAHGGFDDFVLQWLRPEKSTFGRPHFYPQTRFLEVDGDLVVDFIGSVEAIEEDYRRLREELEDAGPLREKHAASSDRTPPEAFYTDDEVIRRVQEVYSSDFEQLGYSLDVADATNPPKTRGPQTQSSLYWSRPL